MLVVATQNEYQILRVNPHPHIYLGSHSFSVEFKLLRPKNMEATRSLRPHIFALTSEDRLA
jgi:hypothetical protein